ncbi:DUF2584 domain-containing protein [Metabacillus sp. GX 13764]|uniref:DUF2584 domain-containing protein n=1 Tax=Metabacillus kandeliae TaxID=2900151 RepID=UPI001E4A1528|nr:DUF2584 domain-containing protein [Metabacillus kandeliae]MCD7032631.1 DUF2584 domain-containing protein [Metabacillus kandeliae]
MGMPLELNTMIVTKGMETRLEENLFQLTKDGYRLYPLDIPMEVRKTKNGELIGIGQIKRVELEQNTTMLVYELVRLNSTN